MAGCFETLFVAKQQSNEAANSTEKTKVEGPKAQDNLRFDFLFNSLSLRSFAASLLRVQKILIFSVTSRNRPRLVVQTLSKQQGD
jgi:hypothetical protein